MTIVGNSFSRDAYPNGRRIVHSNVLDSLELDHVRIFSKSLFKFCRYLVIIVRSSSFSPKSKITKSGAKKTNAPTNSAKWFLNSDQEKNSSIKKRQFKYVMTSAIKCLDYNKLWSLVIKMKFYSFLNNTLPMKKKWIT